MPPSLELVNQALAAGATMNPQALADAIYAAQEQDVNRQAGNAAQQVAENVWGRGIGLSSVAGYLMGQNELARTTALAKARQDAVHDSVVAQQQALGQAAGQVTNNLNRQQQASQFKSAQEQQRSLANQELVTRGVSDLAKTAAGLGGLVFGQDIRRGLRNLAGVGGPTSPGGGYERMLPMDQRPGGATPLLPESATNAGAFSQSLTPAPTSFAPNLSDLTTSASGGFPALTSASYIPDYSSAFDTSWLSSPTDYSAYTPDTSYLDWQPTFDMSGANLNDLLGFYPGY